LRPTGSHFSALKTENPPAGALLAVGEGRREPRWCAELLTSTRRSSDFATAPARGLTLVGVDYPADAELEARILVTRDRRTPDEVGRIEG